MLVENVEPIHLKRRPPIGGIRKELQRASVLYREGSQETSYLTLENPLVDGKFAVCFESSSFLVSGGVLQKKRATPRLDADAG